LGRPFPYIFLWHRPTEKVRAVSKLDNSTVEQPSASALPVDGSGKRHCVLDVEEAACFLHMHPVTLLEKARSGEIPGAKPGKCWVFLEADLAAYLRSLYPQQWRALQGDSMEVSQCHSSNARTRHIGGSNSPTTDDDYSEALALPTKRKPGNTTTS
jgi:hypothetical protein